MRKSFFRDLLVVCLLILIVACSVMLLVGYVSRPDTPKRFTIARQELYPISVPMKYDKYGFLPMIEMNVDGQLLQLAIDTGLDYAAFQLNSSKIKELNLAAAGKSGFFSGIMGLPRRTRLFRVRNANIASIALQDVYVTEEPREFDSFDGLVGNEFFREFVTLIDYGAMELVLYPKDMPPKDIIDGEWKQVPFSNDNIGIVINGTIGEFGEILRFCLDTGVTVNYEGKSYGIIKSKNVRDISSTGEIMIPQISKGPIQTISTKMTLIDGIDLGLQEFLVWDFPRPAVDGFLGHNFLVRYKVLISFETETLYIKDFQQGSEASNDRSGRVNIKTSHFGRR